ncbi:MAG: hypothetical protein ABS902_08310, partial [Priestia megaterium]
HKMLNPVKVYTSMTSTAGQGFRRFFAQLSNFCYKAGNRGKEQNRRNWVTLGINFNGPQNLYSLK